MSEAAIEATEAEAYEAQRRRSLRSEGTGRGAYEARECRRGLSYEASARSEVSADGARGSGRSCSNGSARRDCAARGDPPAPSTRRPVRAALEPRADHLGRSVRWTSTPRWRWIPCAAQLEEPNRRADRATWAAVAGVAASQVLDSFDDTLEPPQRERRP